VTAQAALDEAELAWRQAQNDDPVISAAMVDLTRLTEDRRVLLETRLTEHPESQTIATELAVVRARMEELRSQERVLNYRLGELRRQLQGDPALREIDSQLEQRRQAADQARAASEALRQALAHREQTAAALQTLTQELPEWRALHEQAVAAQADLARAQESDAIRQAREAMAAAQRAYEAQLAEWLAKDPRGAGPWRHSQEAQTKLAETRALVRELELQLEAHRRQFEKNNDEISAAWKSRDAARQAFLRSQVERANAERGALDQARRAMQARVEEVLAADPDGQAKLAELEALRQRLQALPPKP